MGWIDELEVGDKVVVVCGNYLDEKYIGKVSRHTLKTGQILVSTKNGTYRFTKDGVPFRQKIRNHPTLERLSKKAVHDIVRQEQCLQIYETMRRTWNNDVLLLSREACDEIITVLHKHGLTKQ